MKGCVDPGHESGDIPHGLRDGIWGKVDWNETGKALMAATHGAIDPAAALPQVLIGDAPYYGRFGFAEAPRGWTCPGPWDPARLLVRCANSAVLPQHGYLGPWAPSDRHDLAN